MKENEWETKYKKEERSGRGYERLRGRKENGKRRNRQTNERGMSGEAK